MSLGSQPCRNVVDVECRATGHHTHAGAVAAARDVIGAFVVFYPEQHASADIWLLVGTSGICFEEFDGGMQVAAAGLYDD